MSNKIVELSSRTPNFSKRLYASFVDFVFIVFLAIALDFILISPVVKNTMGYNEIKEEYVTLNEQYRDIQDEYGIYVYDSSSNRELNDDIPQEVIDDFLKDERVIKLKEIIPPLQEKLLTYDISILVTDYVVASLLGCLFANIMFGKGVSFGLLLAGIRMVDVNKEKPKIGKVFAYGALKWVIFYILGAATVAIVPIVMLCKAYYDEECLSPLEKALGLKFYLLEKYSSD